MKEKTSSTEKVEYELQYYDPKYNEWCKLKAQVSPTNPYSDIVGNEVRLSRTWGLPDDTQWQVIRRSTQSVMVIREWKAQ